MTRQSMAEAGGGLQAALLAARLADLLNKGPLALLIVHLLAIDSTISWEFRGAGHQQTAICGMVVTNRRLTRSC